MRTARDVSGRGAKDADTEEMFATSLQCYPSESLSGAKIP